MGIRKYIEISTCGEALTAGDHTFYIGIPSEYVSVLLIMRIFIDYQAHFVKNKHLYRRIGVCIFYSKIIFTSVFCRNSIIYYNFLHLRSRHWLGRWLRGWCRLRRWLWSRCWFGCRLRSRCWFGCRLWSRCWLGRLNTSGAADEGRQL